MDAHRPPPPESKSTGGRSAASLCSNICRGARRPRRPPRLERRSAASADCSKPSRIAQFHSKSLRTTQNRSKPLKIAQILFKLTQNYEHPVNLESFWATYSRFCLRSRDQDSNICSNSCRTECQHANIWPTSTFAVNQFNISTHPFNST